MSKWRLEGRQRGASVLRDDGSSTLLVPSSGQTDQPERNKLWSDVFIAMREGKLVSKAAEVESRNGSNKQAIRAEAMKTRLCKALIEVIDEHGYAEASFSRIQQAAGVSRGAMTHHFPSKHDLVCEATISMLDASLSLIAKRLEGRRAPEALTFAQTLKESWERGGDTREGRALAEILVASRTDAALSAALHERLQEWDRKSSESISQLFVGSGEEEDDVVVLWSICRSFLRGLFIHRQFVSDPQFLTRMFRRFTDIMEPHMTLRSDRDRSRE